MDSSVFLSLELCKKGSEAKVAMIILVCHIATLLPLPVWVYG